MCKPKRKICRKGWRGWNHWPLAPLEFAQRAGRQRIFASNVSQNDAMCGERFWRDALSVSTLVPAHRGGQPIVQTTWEIASTIGGFPVEFWQRNRLGWGYEGCMLGVGRYTLTWSFSDRIDISFQCYPVSRRSLRRRRDKYSSVLLPAQIRSHEQVKKMIQ